MRHLRLVEERRLSGSTSPTRSADEPASLSPRQRAPISTKIRRAGRTLHPSCDAQAPLGREARDHPARRAVPSAGAAYAAPARYPAGDVSIVGTSASKPPASQALADRPSCPDRIWNRIPDTVQSRIVELALAKPELSPHELAVRFTDEQQDFVPEASVYRLLKARDLITRPAFILVKAAHRFHTPTTAPTSSGRPTSPTEGDRLGR